MKTTILLAAMVGMISGCMTYDDEMAEPWRSEPARSMPLSDEDARAIQELRDLGISPKVLVEMLRGELQDPNKSTVIEHVQQTAAPAADNGAIQSEANSTPIQQLATPPMAPQPDVQKTVIVKVAATDPVEQAIINADKVVIRGIDGNKTIAVVMPAEVSDTTYFRNRLAAHGSWIRLSPYGWVWRPAITIVNRLWRPYCDGGKWVWTNHGWYWHSLYSWGWATFHYGRWTRVARHGWVWVPGKAWAPAWVHWRHSSTHFAWAPLPYGSRYLPRAGFSHYGQSVPSDYHFGLTYRDYVYVPRTHFRDRKLTHVIAKPRNHASLFNDTVIIRNAYTSGDNGVVNSQLPRDLSVNPGRRSTKTREIIRNRVLKSPRRVTTSRTSGATGYTSSPTSLETRAATSASSTSVTTSGRSASRSTSSGQSNGRRSTNVRSVIRNLDAGVVPARTEGKHQSEPVTSTRTATRRQAQTLYRTRPKEDSASASAPATKTSQPSVVPATTSEGRTASPSKGSSRSSRLRDLLRSRMSTRR